MTRRNMICRGAGAVLLGAGCGAALLGLGGETAALGYFLACIAGIVLMVNGQHVLTAIRAERRGHSLTARAVHAGRVRRRLNPSDGERR